MCNHFGSLIFCKRWTVRPETTNIYPSFLFHFPNSITAWLNPSNLTYVFGLTFPPVAVQLLGWTDALLHFHRTYLVPHLDSINIFLEGWMLELLQDDVSFDVEIWTAQSRTDTQSEKSVKTAGYHSLSAYITVSSVFRSMLLIVHV